VSQVTPEFPFLFRNPPPPLLFRSSRDPLTVSQVTPAEFTGHKEVVKLERARLEDGEIEINFEFRKQRYCYSPSDHSFERLRFPDKVNALQSTVHKLDTIKSDKSVT
jgi:hypothetical protein